MRHPGLLFFVTLWLLICSGCSQEQPDNKTSTRRPIQLRLIYSTEVGRLVKAAANRYASSKPTLSDGTEIRISVAGRTAMESSLAIANGKEKTDIWLAPSLSLVNLTNSSLTNLGPKQIDCKPIFGTPIIAALREKLSDKLQSSDSSFTLSSLLPPAANSAHFYFSHPDPLRSTVGLGVLAQLADHAARRKDFTEVADYNLKKIETELQKMESHALRYSSDSIDLLGLLYSDKKNAHRFVLTTEQQLYEFKKTLGKERAKKKARLVPAFFETGTYVQEYNLCTSDADWVTNARRAAIRHLTAFLTDAEMNSLYEEYGFRYPSSPEDATAPAKDAEGSDSTSEQPKKAFSLDELPPNIARPLSGKQLGELVEQWPQFKRKAAVAAIVDNSGSMTEEPLAAGKSMLEKVLRSLDSQDLKALLSFTADVKVEHAPTTDVEPVIDTLWKLKAAGGSALYDSLKQSVDLLTLHSDKSYRKIIVLFTDGEDKNSKIALSTVKGALCRRVRNNQISLIIIGVGSPKIDYTDLNEIAAACGGSFYEAGINDMNTLYATSLSTL